MKPSANPARPPVTTASTPISTSTFSRSHSYSYRVCLLITILLQLQTGGKFCEGVYGASFGVRTLREDLPTEASTSSLAQSWFKPHSGVKSSVIDSILSEVLRNTPNAAREEIFHALLSESETPKLRDSRFLGLRYDYDYGDPFDPSFCDATGDFKEEADSTTTVGPPGDENDEPFPFPGIPDYPDPSTTEGTVDILPEGCYYYKGNDTYKKYLVCNDETMSEIPTDIPSGLELDIFEMSATNVKCIRPHAFSNVYVVWLNLKENIIQSIAPEAFANVTGLKYLTMNYNQLKAPIWFRVHAGLDSLESIELDHNDICMGALIRNGYGYGYGYDERPPAPEFGIQGPFLTSVRYISLRSNPLEFIPSYFFARFSGTERVDKIDLSASRLRYIDADAFKPFKSIALVDLSENHALMDVDELSKAATGLAAANIQQLILSYNILHRVPKEALQIMSDTLTTLELRGNNFLQLSDGSFPYMFKLTALNLDSCKISRISPGAFETLPNLEILSLRGNELTSVPAALTSLGNLRILSLSDNKDDRGLAFQIGNKAFASQTRLHTLYLNNVRLNTLNSTSFEGLTRLQNLSLENAYLESVEDETFLHTPQLTYLDIRSNPLNSSKFTPEASQGLQRLKILIMSNCGLSFSAWKEKAEHFYAPFRYMEALEHLDLSSNQITQLYPELFGNLVHLRHLDLNKNKIQPWGVRIFESNPYLEELHLAENQLVTVSRRMLKDFKTVSEKVDLSENPFTCDTGICYMKAAVENGTLSLHNWNVTPPVAYRCHRPAKPQIRIPIKSLTDEDCPAPGGGEGGGEETSTLADVVSTKTEEDPRIDGFGEESDSSLTTILVLAACLIVVAACGVVAYRRRAQLHYTWLNLKGKLGKRKHGESNLLRKKKTSASEADGDGIYDFDYDVFISYSHHDSEFIQDQLVPILEGKGRLLLNDDQQQREESVSAAVANGDLWDPTFKVCLHERDFEVGMSITENIIDSVDRSRKVVIVVSRNYLESQWCLFEMNLAYHRLVEVRRSCFLLILLEDIPAESRTKVLNYLMKSTTYLRWPGAGGTATANENTLFWTRLRHALLKPSGTNP